MKTNKNKKIKIWIITSWVFLTTIIIILSLFVRNDLETNLLLELESLISLSLGFIYMKEGE